MSTEKQTLIEKEVAEKMSGATRTELDAWMEDQEFKDILAMSPMEFSLWCFKKNQHGETMNEHWTKYSDAKNAELLAEHINKFRWKMDHWSNVFTNDLPNQVTALNTCTTTASDKIKESVESLEKTLHKAHRGLITATWVLALFTLVLAIATIALVMMERKN